MFGFLSGGNCLEYRQAYAICCQNQFEHYGRISTVFHSYESVFVYCLAIDLGFATQPPADSPSCCRWMRRCSTERIPGDLRPYLASLAILLGSIKLDDDVQDSGSLLARLARRLLKRPIQSALDFFSTLDPQFEANLRQVLAAQQAIEEKKQVTLAEFQAPTARGFADIFAMFARLKTSDTSTCETIEAIGNHVGAAIIAFDCAVDWKRDRKSGNYNPLLNSTEVLDAPQECQLRLTKIGWLCDSIACQSTLCTRIIRYQFDRISSLRKSFNHDAVIPKRLAVAVNRCDASGDRTQGVENR